MEGREIETPKIFDDPTSTPEHSNLRSMEIHKVERGATFLNLVRKILCSDSDVAQVEVAMNYRM